MKPFLSWNGLKWRSNYLRTCLANRCMKLIEMKHGCPQTQFKAMAADAEMLSVFPRKELGGAALSAGSGCLCNNGCCKTSVECSFCFSSFFVKLKSSSDFFELWKLSANVKNLWQKVNFWKVRDTCITEVCKVECISVKNNTCVHTCVHTQRNTWKDAPHTKPWLSFLQSR